MSGQYRDSSDNKAIEAAIWEYVDLKDVITKVEAKLEIETESAIGINTLLDTVSITL